MEQQCLVSKFENEVKGIFEKAEFQALDDKVLRNALDAKSVHGLKVDMAPDGYLEHSRFYRGKHTKTVSRWTQGKKGWLVLAWQRCIVLVVAWPVSLQCVLSTKMAVTPARAAA